MHACVHIHAHVRTRACAHMANLEDISLQSRNGKGVENSRAAGSKKKAKVSKSPVSTEQEALEPSKQDRGQGSTRN